MQHFANFGITKQANKQLKRLYEMKATGKGEGRFPEGIGSVAKTAAVLTSKGYPPDMSRYTDTVNRAVRDERYRRNEKSLLNPDPLSGWRMPYNDRDSAKGMIKKRQATPRTISSTQDKSKPNLDDFTEVRANKDPVINAGYLGFRKDPYKGYGGMMEEPVDYKKKIINRGVNRFDMRGGVEP